MYQFYVESWKTPHLYYTIDKLIKIDKIIKKD